MAELSAAEEIVRRAHPEALIDGFDADTAEAFLYDWRIWQRPKQATPPGDWTVWLILAGRGFGKTRTGSEWVREQVNSGRFRRVTLVGPDEGIRQGFPQSGTTWIGVLDYYASMLKV